jgi:hypothetical protein
VFLITIIATAIDGDQVERDAGGMGGGGEGVVAELWWWTGGAVMVELSYEEHGVGFG